MIFFDQNLILRSGRYLIVYPAGTDQRRQRGKPRGDPPAPGSWRAVCDCDRPVCEFSAASFRLNGRFIYQTDFDHDEIDALLEVFSDSAYEHRFLVVTQDNDYIFEDPFGEQAMEYKLNPKHRIRDCRQVLDESISEYIRDPHHTHITACFCHFQQEEGVDYYKDMLKRKFFGRYQIIQTSPYSIVILKDGANKGTGIAKIAALTGVSLDEIAVVGDSENDFEMFAMIPHSYCMSHARPDIQAKAKTIVDSVAECIDLILKENEQERLENLNLL